MPNVCIQPISSGGAQLFSLRSHARSQGRRNSIQRSIARRKSVCRIADIRCRLLKHNFKPGGAVREMTLMSENPLEKIEKTGEARCLASDQRRARRSRLGLGSEIADRRGS